MWSPKVPEIPGLYWFQGWPEYGQKDSDPFLFLIEVFRPEPEDGSHKVGFVLYRKDREIINPHEYFGLWHRISKPIGILGKDDLVATIKRINKNAL